jgi:hypothetical protein
MNRRRSKAVPHAVDRTSCGLYKPGHDVHYIQAKLASECDPANYRTGEVVSVDDDGWITLAADGEVLRLWNHDPARARQCFKESVGRVGLPGRSLLHAPTATGRYCICIAQEATRCALASSADLSAAGLVERLITHGGFLLPAAEIVRHLDDRDDQEA